MSNEKSGRTGKFCVAAGCTSTHKDNLAWPFIPTPLPLFPYFTYSCTLPFSECCSHFLGRRQLTCWSRCGKGHRRCIYKVFLTIRGGGLEQMARSKHYLNFISDLSANDHWLYKGTTSNLKVYNFNFRTLCQRTITEIASTILCWISYQ
jgi:hypothetical protein